MFSKYDHEIAKVFKGRGYDLSTADRTLLDPIIQPFNSNVHMGTAILLRYRRLVHPTEYYVPKDCADPQWRETILPKLRSDRFNTF